MKTINKKNRILFLLHLPPPVHGSSVIGKNIRDSIKINESFNCNYINLLASSNVSEPGKVSIKKIFSFSITVFKVLLSMMRRRPQLCYIALTTTGFAFYKDLILISLLKLFHIKIIYHLHNKGIKYYQKRKINKFCYKFIFKKSDTIILSKYLYSDIISFVNKSNLHICQNGIADNNNFNKRLRNKEGSSPIGSLLFLSNLIESKGIIILMKALALLKQKKIPFKCEIIGNEGNVSISQLIDLKNKLGLNTEIAFHGGIYGTEKKYAFLEADIFVLPTYNECFPLVLLEAMSYSLPVVTTFEGGIPDIVEENVTGFLIPPKDSIALADKLELLIKNPELRHRLGNAGRKKFECEFTVKKFEQRLERILQEVIEK